MSVFLGIVLVLSLSFEWQGFLLVNIVTSYATIACMWGVSRRKELFIVCAKVWLCATSVIFAIHLYHYADWEVGIAIPHGKFCNVSTCDSCKCCWTASLYLSLLSAL